MYAVVESGGKQYSATPGKLIEVEKLDAAKGDTIVLDHVLLVADDAAITVGTPLVVGATVTCTVTRQARYRKVTWFKYVPKKRIRKKGGHRQPFTQLRIESIQA